MSASGPAAPSGCPRRFLSRAPGKTLCLVGESGSGKSVTATAIMGLHDRTVASVTADVLRVGDRDILACGERELSRLRGSLMSMIFQDPMSCLNPALTIGYQLREALFLHERVSRRAAEDRVLEILRLVRIPSPSAASSPIRISSPAACASAS